MFVRSQLDRLAEVTNHGILGINLLNEIVICNSSTADLFEMSVEDILGKDLWQLMPDDSLPYIRDSETIEFSTLSRIGNKTIIASRMPYKDDQGRVIGAVAFLRDMTEYEDLRVKVNMLQEVRTLLTAIINSTQDAISVVDENGLGILINPAYTHLTGLTEEDVIGKPPTVDIAEGESMHVKVLRTRQPVKGVSMKVGPNRKEVIVNVAPVIVSGQLRGTVGVLHDISEIHKLSEELERAKRLIRHLEAKYTFNDIIGESEAIKAAIEQAQRAAVTPATVLLRGESGTGKELFAHAIHRSSERQKGQFIRVNCAALADSLLESELFGYVEGAFTGAKRGGKAGLFEEANGGTIFLDEIGEISLNLQAKLLRVLQEREIVKVGDNRSFNVDVRVIAATNANLEAELRAGKFREDLYYRLNVIPVIIPPLRQRRDDVPLIVHHLIRRFNQEYGRCVEHVSEETLKILMGYHWPGNVRELENILGRAIINMRAGETVVEQHRLPVLTFPSDNYSEVQFVDLGQSSLSEEEEGFEELQRQWERALLLVTLQRTGGNKTKAAQHLKMSIRNFYYKLKRHALI
ncbi:sigma-54 interaction domain-containing protein [Desulfosporosinus metallidurans]|uniref:Transcriptional regulator BkdR of isoleucine and valine catabolism operon n=1 Tax=Desulfosporosinus metallidurans TaxID=1888891 RepID=A0A1Q8QXU0_9FIRM|nr:sigma-54-dependent Fis family transcriptional regulator [Desulfosporosinus metallidurans]OLN32172.1 Transcriptional regulator BkdR of isoleucine and valine catabolism operon [Desulfosporosinus metallidurans]